jgi:hypothetical protein
MFVAPSGGPLRRLAAQSLSKAARPILQHHAITGKRDLSARALYFSAQTAHRQYSIA